MERFSGRRKSCFWFSGLREDQVVSKASWLIMQTLTNQVNLPLRI